MAAAYPPWPRLPNVPETEANSTAKSRSVPATAASARAARRPWGAHLRHVLGGGAAQQAVAEGAGGVHHAVQVAEALPDLRHHARQRAGRGDVGGERGDAAAVRLDPGQGVGVGAGPAGRLTRATRPAPSPARRRRATAGPGRRARRGSGTGRRAAPAAGRCRRRAAGRGPERVARRRGSRPRPDRRRPARPRARRRRRGRGRRRRGRSPGYSMAAVRTSPHRAARAGSGASPAATGWARSVATRKRPERCRWPRVFRAARQAYRPAASSAWSGRAGPVFHRCTTPSTGAPISSQSRWNAVSSGWGMTRRSAPVAGAGPSGSTSTTRAPSARSARTVAAPAASGPPSVQDHPGAGRRAAGRGGRRRGVHSMRVSSPGAEADRCAGSGACVPRSARRRPGRRGPAARRPRRTRRPARRCGAPARSPRW